MRAAHLISIAAYAALATGADEDEILFGGISGFLKSGPIVGNLAEVDQSAANRLGQAGPIAGGQWEVFTRPPRCGRLGFGHWRFRRKWESGVRTGALRLTANAAQPTEDVNCREKDGVSDGWPSGLRRRS